MQKLVYRIVNTEAFRNFILEVIFNAQEGFYITIGPLTRTQRQNAMFHALCTDVSKQLPYMGKMRTPAQWKVLFISGHAIATNIGADMVPGLEGEFVNLRESSAQMNVKRMNSCIEYVLAYCAENDIKLTETRYQDVPEAKTI